MKWIMDMVTEKHDSIIESINKTSKTMLNYIYHYSGYNLKYNVQQTPTNISKPKLVYYHEINGFNILLFMYSLISFLLLIYIYNSECADVISISIVDRIREYARCKEFVLVCISIILISTAYIIGGPIRLILIIAFNVISSITLTSQKNRTKLIDLAIKVYTTLTRKN